MIRPVCAVLEVSLAYFDIHAHFTEMKELSPHRFQLFPLLSDELLDLLVVVLAHAVHYFSVRIIEHVCMVTVFHFFESSLCGSAALR